jgi:hypothetical protein
LIERSRCGELIGRAVFWQMMQFFA